MNGEGLFSDFARTLEQVSRTSSKNEKVRILAEYFSSLRQHELATVCRFILGKESAAGKVGVGFSIIQGALAQVISISSEEMSRLYLKYGDLGEVIKELMQKKEKAPSLLTGKLSIDEVQKAMNDMAFASGKGSSDLKKRILTGLLLRAEPLEAKYLVRILTNEMRIGATEGLVLDAIASAFKVKNVRQWYLVVGDVGEVARRAAAGESRMPDPVLMRPVSFMLALPVMDASEAWKHFGKKVIAEYKYDGVRLQAHVNYGEVKLFSRRMEDITDTMPEVSGTLSEMKGIRCILDGEAVAWKNEKPIPFVQLQKRLHRKKLDDKIIRDIPITYFVFDVLKYDEKSLLDSSLSERKHILGRVESIFRNQVRKAEVFTVSSEQDIASLFRQSRELGYEGLMLKDPDSPYTPGKRGGAWVKIKEELDTLDVVVVKAEYGNGKRAGLLSDLTFAVWDGSELKPVGKAYSGLTDKEIKDMTELLPRLAEKRLWNGFLVKPQIVLEVAFDSIQRSSRHLSGYALRFPRIKRIRWDKRAEDADSVQRVAQIYNSQISAR